MSFWRFRVDARFDGIHWPEESHFETFDKDTGRIGDMRVDNPERAKQMEPYRHERGFEINIMGPFPRKYRSLTITHRWKLNL